MANPEIEAAEYAAISYTCKKWDVCPQRCPECMEFLTNYEPGERVERDASLCWCCDKATGGCSWSRNFEPVPGWDAEKHIRSYNSGWNHKNRISYVAYTVKNCPEFKRG